MTKNSNRTKAFVTSISFMVVVAVAFSVPMANGAFAQSFLPMMGTAQNQQQQQMAQPKLEDIPVDELLRQETLSGSVRDARADNTPPKTLKDLQEISSYKPEAGEESKMPFNIRKESMKEAALSYGARGGLAARSYEINKEIGGHEGSLDKVYDFRQLLIAAPSGFMIEPPIISESLKALLIEGDGQKAAVSDAIYRINENVKIVSAPRNWRQYLERTWGPVEEPPEILRPKDDAERAEWRKNVQKLGQLLHHS